MNGFFEKLLAQHGDSPRSLDWSPEGQRERFRVLKEVGITSTCSVVDVGCGLGHFYRYIKEDGYCGRYVGLDVSEAMVEGAKKYNEDVPFFVKSAEGDRLPEADYIVSSGVLNVECGNNFGFAQILISQCFRSAKLACAVNMLSTNSVTRREGRHYFEPCAMLALAFDLTPKVTFRHDYRDNDFTLYLYK